MVLGTKLHEMLDFPAQIKFKVIGENTPELLELIKQKLSKLNIQLESQPSLSLSKNEGWASYNIDVKVENKELLEKLYVDLGAIPQVKMVI